MLEHFGKSDWSELETHVIDGVFSPPMRASNQKRVVEDNSRRSRRPPRNSELHNETIPAALFRQQGSIYKTTINRLIRAGHKFNILITLRTGEEDELFELTQVKRHGEQWMYQRYDGPEGQQLIVLNTDPIEPLPVSNEPPITVVRDGIYWVARFKWNKANQARVKAAGFTFSPVVRWWFTLDERIARRFQAQLRGDVPAVEACKESQVQLERIPAHLRKPTRRPAVNFNRRGRR